MRRTKDGYGRYLTAADPTKDEANQLWGVEVLVTTKHTAGTGLLIDTSKFGRVLVPSHRLRCRAALLSGDDTSPNRHKD